MNTHIPEIRYLKKHGSDKHQIYDKVASGERRKWDWQIYIYIYETPTSIFDFFQNKRPEVRVGKVNMH